MQEEGVCRSVGGVECQGLMNGIMNKPKSQELQVGIRGARYATEDEKVEGKRE